LQGLLSNRERFREIIIALDLKGGSHVGIYAIVAETVVFAGVIRQAAAEHTLRVWKMPACERLERLQIFDQGRLFLLGQIQFQMFIVVPHDRG
jgi:hypothetical protein